MGDLHRHAEIFRHVHRTVAPLRPDEDWICLEFGNYLTDISQFRDPFANMLAKRTVWGQGLGSFGLFALVPVIGTLVSEAILNWAVDLDEWIDRMFGVHEPAEKRHGKLAAYFKDVFEGVTHLVFADDVKEAAVWHPLLAPALGDIERLPSAEVTRLYRALFTQYYPHEHTDFPPYVLYGESRVNHRLYRKGPHGLSAYLEEYTDYLSESLSKLEVEWKEASRAAKGDPRRHDVLARLGKALHGMEDYYFHSNHLELHLWNELRRGRPKGETEEEYRRWFAANVASHWLPPERTGAPEPGAAEDRPSRAHQVRAHLRRLRYPLYRPVNTLDPEKSEPATGILFTAGFDKKDLFHTLSLALESMEGALARLEHLFVRLPEDMQTTHGSKRPTRLHDSELVLLRVLFNKEERSRMGRDEDYLKKRLAIHVKQLGDGLYEKGIAHLHGSGYLNDAARDSWLRAIATDREMEDFGDLTPGVSGFLINLLAQGQQELERSRRLSRQFDTARDFGPGNSLDTRSDNGASGEHIGTHTLMSKDTAKSLPVHEETRRLARFASMAVARHLVTEVNTNPSTAGGLDWDRILRHYLRFPSAGAAMWESQVLAHVRRTGADPTYDDIPDKVVQPQVQGPDAALRLAARRKGTLRAELEKRYHDLEKRVDQFQLLLRF